MADDDDDDDGDEGEDGDEGDEEDGDVPEGESRGGSRAESEIKPDMTPTAGQPEPSVSETTPMDISTGDESPLPIHTSPPPPPSVPLVQPHFQQPPSHFEGSPLKNVIAAISPTGPSPKLSPKSETPVGIPTPVQAEQAQGLSKPIPAPVESVESPHSRGASQVVEQATIIETIPDMDKERPDVPHEEHNAMAMRTEVVTTDDQPSTLAVHGTQQTWQTDLEPTNPPPVTEFTQVEDNAAASSSAASEAKSGAQPIAEIVSERIVDTATTLEPGTQIREAEGDVSLTPDFTSTTVETLPAPGPIDTNAGPAAPDALEENEPESPDLFSGLEAALNQQGGPREVSAPNTNPGIEETKAEPSATVECEKT
ncbi:hypothetical protein F4779DRAFT_426423 [Xylariaceae sp. FL0662B]|nr:hypothetical protein F4779DRAFT_426423 [Xylariaceae sp. FL0662B]